MLVRLDQVEPPELPNSLIQSAPEETFNYAWISSLLEQVLEEVQKKCSARDLTVHWQVFRDRIVIPILNRTGPLRTCVLLIFGDFLPQISKDFADLAGFGVYWPYLYSKQASVKGPALSAPRQKSKLADLEGKPAAAGKLHAQ
jgi:hypothetical protein